MLIAKLDRVEKLIEEQEKMQNCYNQGELKSRLANARVDIWYLPALSKNDVTKFEEVRRAMFVDGVCCLERIIDLN